MTESIHRALWEWLLPCASITKLFFNFASAEDGATAIATAGDTLTEEYIDGSQRRRYAFELVRYLPATETSNDDGNVDMMEDVERIVAWVRAQDDAGNLPAMPDGCAAERITPLDVGAGYAAAQDGSLAKYTVPFAIDYIKE